MSKQFKKGDVVWSIVNWNGKLGQAAWHSNVN